MEINYTDVYKEIDFISRELRKAIKHMPRYNRYNEGVGKGYQKINKVA